MKAEILSRTDLVFLAEISVLLFVGVFVGAIFWAYRSSAKADYEARGYMPLDDGDVVEGGRTHGA
jgi:cbb3-type cytochrome oxidase subunit 3